jgi:SAM-dependent methyltransferase
LPFAAGVFDAVWVSQVIHHVPDLAAFGREVGRVLRPGGNLVLRGGFAVPEGLLLRRYFPAAFHPDTTALLPAVAAGFAAAGLRQVAHRQVVQKLADNPEQFVARTRTRSLSNLARLPDAAFADGMRRLDDDARSGRLPEPLAETLDLVVFRP